jgi:hypothetical protein
MLKKQGRISREEIDCQIVIHGMSTTEKIKQVDSIILQLQSGIIDKETAIMEIRSCNVEEAKKILEKANKEREQEMKQIEKNHLVITFPSIVSK